MGNSLLSRATPAALCESFDGKTRFERRELIDADDEGQDTDVVDKEDNETDRFERRFTKEIAGLKLELRSSLDNGLTSVRQDFHQELTSFSRELHDGLTDVRQDFATARVEMLKWSFLFWIGQVTVIGGLFALLRGPR